MAVPKKDAKAKTEAGKRPQPSGSEDEMIQVRTPNKKGYVGRLNRAKYEAMRDVLTRIMPAKGPGITQNEMMERVLAEADKKVFPAKTGMWWAKGVQLDLEARGVLVRDQGKPLRWKKA